MPRPSSMRASSAIHSLGLIVASLGLSSCLGDQPISAETRPISVDQSASGSGSVLNGDVATVAHLQSSTSPTYLTLTVAKQDQPIAASSNSVAIPITAGSGFIVSNDGYLVTAAHVAEAVGNEISARAANERIYTGIVKAIDRSNDIALIKLRSYNGQAVVPAAPACMAKDGLVFTYGKPHGHGDTQRLGSLQAMHFGRPVAYGSYGYSDAMVLHMGTQRGESGGPVFNGQGQLVGMVVSTLSDAKSGKSINLAHAQHSNTIARFICSSGICPAGWQALAQRPVDSCG